jgi:hypothetical protein
MKATKLPTPSTGTECSGEPCAAAASEFKVVKQKCSQGVPSSLVKTLTAKAGERASRKASQQCKGAGCACVGRFYVIELGHTPSGDDCVWYVAGVWRGVCAPGEGAVVAGPTDDLVSTIEAHGELEEGPVPDRPKGRCDRRACAAHASATIELDASPTDGIDSALFRALVDAAARAAEQRAVRLCPEKCVCKGEFVVIDSGVKPINVGRLKWIWWVGGEWRGKCLQLV